MIVDYKTNRFQLDAVFQALQKIIVQHLYADKALETVLRMHRYTPRQKQFIAETTYDIIRYWRYLSVLSNTEELNHRSFVRMFYVFAFFKKWKTINFNVDIKEGLIIERMKRFSKVTKISESVPDWLDEWGNTAYGSNWSGIINALNRKPSLYLRVNTLKTRLDHLQDILRVQGVETVDVPEFPEALIVEPYENVFAVPAFKEGLFEVQDAASQQVAKMLDPLPGERVVDGCAGNGGKTVHLACLMKNKGKVLALDTDDKKLKTLQQRAARAGASIIEVRHIDSTKTVKRLEGTADKLLLDVPCSGTGILRRNPDIKWRITPENIQRLIELQANILSRYSNLVKPGGRLLYSTCSILPEENQHQVQAFLARETNWKLVKEQQLLPDKQNCDGFYMALLERT